LLQEKTEKEILHKNSPKVKTQKNSGHIHKLASTIFPLPANNPASLNSLSNIQNIPASLACQAVPYFEKSYKGF